MAHATAFQGAAAALNCTASTTEEMGCREPEARAPGAVNTGHSEHHWVEMQRGAIGQKFENWLPPQYLHEKHHEVKKKRTEETVLSSTRKMVKLPQTGRDQYCSTGEKQSLL